MRDFKIVSTVNARTPASHVSVLEFHTVTLPTISMHDYVYVSENLRYDQFCDAIRQLFGSDIKNHDLKALYRKISTNPDAKVDWSEVGRTHYNIGEPVPTIRGLSRFLNKQ